MKFYTHSLLISVLLLFVTACGGGGGGGAPVQGGVGEATPNGIYYGTYTEDDGTPYDDFVGLVQGGRFVGLSLTNSKIHTGTAAVDGQSLSGTLNVLEIGGDTPLLDSTLAATFVEGVSISGTITDTDGMDTFSLTIDPIYNRLPNTILYGMYTASLGGTNFTITSNNDGVFNGSSNGSTGSCTYSGTQGSFDATHNFYGLEVGITGGDDCLLAGDYTGYAFNDDQITGSGLNDRLVWVIDDPDFILIVVMDRQS